jgi:16S rRNA (adenine(1408)-N(1))-methyltransferase
MASQAPDRLFIGIDANPARARELSNRAFRARMPNLVYVRAAVEDLPAELAGLADRISIVLPWGSLLAAVARPSMSLLEGIRALCQPNATLTVVLAIDHDRDGSELERLGLAAIVRGDLEGHLKVTYCEAGFLVRAVRTLRAEELRQWPSTWARPLAWGRARSFVHIEARNSGISR